MSNVGLITFWFPGKPIPIRRQGHIMKVLNKVEIAQVAGGATAPKDPALGLFPQTGIAFIDNIHKAEWSIYGKALFGWLVK